MALIIHRRSGSSRSSPRLVLVGGDGRWARPLLQLVTSIGYAPSWIERPHDPLELGALDVDDVVLAASSADADWVLAHRGTVAGGPVVVMTGSLQAVSTSISSHRVVPLVWPITGETLRATLERSRRSVVDSAA